MKHDPRPFHLVHCKRV